MNAVSLFSGVGGFEVGFARAGIETLLQAERFARKVEVAESGCWLWTGRKTVRGYGMVTQDKRSLMAHRVAYEWAKGPIPPGLHIDHLCRVRACVNPAHLDVVTPRENNRRGNGWAGTKARQTHCVAGHEFTEANTYIRPNGSRLCRACRNRRVMASYRSSR